jgi:hypothetical protein
LSWTRRSRTARSAAQCGGPRAEDRHCRALDLGDPLDEDEAIGKRLVIYRDHDSRIALKALGLEGGLVSHEDHVIPVYDEPDGSHVGPAVLTNRRELARSGAMGEGLAVVVDKVSLLFVLRSRR